MESCADCEKPFPFLQRAHIVARHKGGSDEPENILRLCPNCHFLRDRDDRIAWLKKRWENIPPEERSETIRRQMAALTPEQREARGRKISRSKGGKKMKSGHRAGGVRDISKEARARAAASNKRTWENKTPEERETWRQRCREIKAKKVAA